MAILEADFVFKLNKEDNCYYATVKSGNKTFAVQCDTGASRTAITVPFLFEGELADEQLTRMEQYLLKRAQHYSNGNKSELTRLARKFKYGNNVEVYGFLADMGNVTIGNTPMEHFFYYLIPSEKAMYALVGNDFLNNCEFTHSLHGDIVVKKFDEDRYKKEHKYAIKSAELNKLIEESALSLAQLQALERFGDGTSTKVTDKTHVFKQQI